MAWTERYCSVAGGGAHDGTSAANAWTLAEAIAAVAAGHRVNVLKGTYANTTTTRTFATAGTATAPIWWRGYDTTIGDIDTNNALTKPSFTFTTGQMVTSGTKQKFSNITISSACTTAGGAVSVSGANISFLRVQFSNTAANAASSACSTTAGGAGATFTLCSFSATTTATSAVSPVGASDIFLGCYIQGGISGVTIGGVSIMIDFCIINSPTTNGVNCAAVSGTVVSNCSIYSCTSGVTTSSATASVTVLNSVISTCTNGVNQSSGGNSSVIVVAGCSFYACTNDIAGVQECASSTDNMYVAQLNTHETVDPFVATGSQNFGLASTALAKSAGIPGAFESSGVSSTGYLDGGAVQMIPTVDTARCAQLINGGHVGS